ncbi:MAG: MarR family winged helix-turn-helix transcriptional regulator [Bacillota bacterium]
MVSFTDFLCFKLGATARRIQRYYNGRYQEHGITIAQSFILFALLERDGLNVKQIAERVILDSSAITGILDRMENENLVERRKDPEDRRALNVYLTNKGKLLAEEVYPIAMEFNSKIRASLSEEESDALTNCLASIDKTI